MPKSSRPVEFGAAAPLPKLPNRIAPICFQRSIQCRDYRERQFLQILILIIATSQRHKTNVNQALLLCSSSHSRYRGDPTLGATARLVPCGLGPACVSAVPGGTAAANGGPRRTHPALRTMAVSGLFARGSGADSIARMAGIRAARRVPEYRIAGRRGTRRGPVATCRRILVAGSRPALAGTRLDRDTRRERRHLSGFRRR